MKRIQYIKFEYGSKRRASASDYYDTESKMKEKKKVICYGIHICERVVCIFFFSYILNQFLCVCAAKVEKWNRGRMFYFFIRIQSRTTIVWFKYFCIINNLKLRLNSQLTTFIQIIGLDKMVGNVEQTNWWGGQKEKEKKNIWNSFAFFFHSIFKPIKISVIRVLFGHCIVTFLRMILLTETQKKTNLIALKSMDLTLWLFFCTQTNPKMRHWLMHN